MSIRRKIELILDKAAAKRAERAAQKSLDKGTDSKKAEKNIGKVGTALKRLKKVAITVGAAMAGIWAVKRVFEFGKAVFRVGADVAAVGSQFRTVFGESQSDMQAWIDNFRKIAGLTNREAQKLSASAGSMAKGFGLSSDEAVNFSQQVLKLSGDLASFNNVPTAEAAQLVQSALIGNTEAARSLQVAFSAADVQARAMEQTGKDTAKSLTQAEKALAALSVMTERAGPQIGDLARTQNDADNRAKQLSARFNQMKETIALGLMPALERLIPIFEQLAEKAEAFADKTAGAVQALLDMAGIADQELAIEVASITNALKGMEEAQREAFLTSRLTRAAGEYQNLRARVMEAKQEMFDALPAFQQVGKSVEDMTNRSIRSMEEEMQRAGEVMNFISGQLATPAGGPAAAPIPSAPPPTGEEEGTGLADPTAAALPEGPGFDPLAGVEDQLVSDTQGIAENMRSVLQDNNPFGELADQAHVTAAFMRDGFEGVGQAIVEDLIAGRAEEQFAQGMAALASGIWPPNPAALAAASKHFAAAAAFRALAGGLGGGGGVSGGGGGGPRGAIGTSRPQITEPPPQPDINIFMDPLDPSNQKAQRFVLGAQQNAVERFGSNIQVNVRPRSGNGA